MEVSELIHFSDFWNYSIDIKKVSNNVTQISYSNYNLDTWQNGADFSRPKWGIYRSLNNAKDLQDEMVLFDNFNIE